jgi:hypothetical protein
MRGGGNKIDRVGQRFGMLVVIAAAPSKNGRTAWTVQCDCGSQPKSVSSANLVNGGTRSCGCMSSAWKSADKLKHGATRNGCRYEYRCWIAMRTRCNNPNVPHWKWYGGAGIRVCERWDSFELFLADVGPAPSQKHSLDRYPNSSGNYEPGNVRWATVQEQRNNTSRNLRITLGGVTKTLAEWCRERGLSYSRALYRLQVGLSIDVALSNDPIPKLIGRRKIAAWRTGLA